MTEQKADRPRKLSLGTRILIGILCGIAVGVFLGEESSPLQVLGDVYVGLLQMTVLPYVTVSLVTKIGRLRFEQARNLAGRVCVVLLALWMISLLTATIRVRCETHPLSTGALCRRRPSKRSPES